MRMCVRLHTHLCLGLWEVCVPSTRMHAGPEVAALTGLGSSILCCCFSDPSGKRELGWLLHIRTIPKSVRKQGHRGSGVGVRTGRATRGRMTTREALAQLIPSLFYFRQSRSSDHAGGMKEKQNVRISLLGRTSLCQMALSAAQRQCPLTHKHGAQKTPSP